MVKSPQQLRSFESLLEVVKALRDPVHGCPWDKEQTHQTLTKHMIEEAFEAVEALESNNRDHMVEELGDVLLQVVLNSELARQDSRFDIMDVIEALNTKLVARHSHVFGEVKAQDSAQALLNWEKEKAAEKARKAAATGGAQATKFDIPEGLPALQRAEKIGAKTKKFNFDWDKIADVKMKVEEELAEFQDAVTTGNRDEMVHEMGDLLFSVAQLARHASLDPEACLREGNRRFESRFFKMKSLAESRGLKLENLPPPELEALWQEIKLIR